MEVLNNNTSSTNKFILDKSVELERFENELKQFLSLMVNKFFENKCINKKPDCSLLKWDFYYPFTNRQNKENKGDIVITSFLKVTIFLQFKTKIHI